MDHVDIFSANANAKRFIESNLMVMFNQSIDQRDVDAQTFPASVFRFQPLTGAGSGAPVASWSQRRRTRWSRSTIFDRRTSPQRREQRQETGPYDRFGLSRRSVDRSGAQRHAHHRRTGTSALDVRVAIAAQAFDPAAAASSSAAVAPRR